jgi:membrane fusion protein (multidrug efflux system)
MRSRDPAGPPRPATAARHLPVLPGLALALGLAACGAGGEESEAPESRPVTVEVVRLAPEPLRNVVRIPGQLAADASVSITPEIDGILESIEFDEGSEVKAGTVLFRLRNDEQRARLGEAEAQLSLAREVHRRTATLAGQNISSSAQLDSAAAQLAVAGARVELARVELAKTEIRAPFDGMLGARHVSPGDRVKKSLGLVEIDAVDQLQLLFNLPEVAVGIVREGAPVQISVAPYPGERFEGRIFFVSPTLDPGSRRLLIKAWVPNPDRRLRPGLFAEIEAEIDRREDAILLPEAAVAADLTGPYVWRVGAEERAERVRIETGLRLDGKVEVRAGLSAGDRVVAAGVHKVTEGAEIEAVEPGGAAAPAAEGLAGAREPGVDS